MPRPGFGPGEPRARARGCTCVHHERGFMQWDVSSCMMHSGLYGGTARPGDSGMSWENENYERLIRTYGREKGLRIWKLYERGAVSMPEAVAMKWAENTIDREYPDAE